MDVTQRIAQFEAMVRPEADPNNDMAWFSLGSAYAQAGRHADAARAYRRCTELNPDMSKAYQLAGSELIAAGDKTSAGELLQAGYTVAARRGDRMPLKAIADLLQSLGLEPPQAPAPVAAGPTPDGGFVCRRTGRPGTQMARPPFRGRLGEWIHQNIAKETFDDWIRQGTKVINELRLDLSRPEDSRTYDQHMREYLGIDDELYRQIAAPDAPANP